MCRVAFYFFLLMPRQTWLAQGKNFFICNWLLLIYVINLLSELQTFSRRAQTDLQGKGVFKSICYLTILLGNAPCENF